MAADQIFPDLRQDRPHSARMYDYFLGGKDNYAADREAAEKAKEAFPGAPLAARLNRAFMHRASRFLADGLGIRQFLDIGTGIPTEPNLHQVVQAVAPESRVVYVDNDPIVLAHARALLTSSPDEQDPYGIVNRLLSALPSGSALVISHATADLAPDEMRKAAEIYRKSGIKVQLRNKQEVQRFFTGLELIDPGIVPSHRWRPDGEQRTARIESAEAKDEQASIWAGVTLMP